MRQAAVEPADLRRRNLDVTDYLLLHLLHGDSLACTLTQVLAYLSRGLVEILLHLLTRTDIRDVKVGHVVHTLYDLSLRYLNTVELGLMQEQLLHRYLLRQHAVWVFVKPAPFVQRTEPRFFDF